MADNHPGKYIAIEAIKKKLLGKKLTYHEIFHLMDEIGNNQMGDILTTYFVAASFKEGFSNDELYYLTKAMVETGRKIEFSGIVADKHSTGGVAGTRTTMIIVPIIAAAGFKIPKLSSRAITSPAGTADCMEVVAGVNLTPARVKQVVETIGGCMIWNGVMGIAPADDVIIEVEEPLSFESFDKIIVSIIAKKVAVSTNHLVLDIPVGPTMKIKRKIDAKRVVEKFELLAKKFDIHLNAIVDEVHEPAGHGVGPQLEVIDVLKVLEQDPQRPMALEAKSLKLAGKLLDLCFEDAKINKSGAEEAQHLLACGKAHEKFLEIVRAQKGNPDVTSTSLKPARHTAHIKSTRSGKVTAINNYNLNTVARILGAPHDKKAGIYLHCKLGDKISKNERLFQIYSSGKYRLQEAQETTHYLPIFQIQ